METDPNESAAGTARLDASPLDDVPPPGPIRPNAVAGEAIAARKEDGQVYLVVRVAGDGPQGEDAEYVGSVSEERLARMSRPDQRTALLDAVRAVRDRRRALAAVQVAGLVGPVLL